MKKQSPAETLLDFIEILRNIRRIRERRRVSLDRMFWEYNNYNVDLFEDRESKIKKYTTEASYPKAFLASNLGFNRASMDPKYTDVLNKFKLEKKSMSGSIRNAIHFETLKRLIIKYFEKGH